MKRTKAEIEKTIRVLSDMKLSFSQNYIQEAFDVSIEALREKAERECKYCDDNFKFWQTQISGELPNVRYCPMCGKRLKVEY